MNAPQHAPAAPGLGTWFAATRPQFLTAIVLPVLLGTSLAWEETGRFDFLLLLLGALAAALAHAGANVLNDYFDHLSGADGLNSDPLTPFAGGSRMIQLGRLTPRHTLIYGILLMGAAIALGLWLVALTGPVLFWLGLIGVILGYAYSAPPLALAYRGWGEVVVAVDFGLFAVAGAYYVQTGTISPSAWVAGAIAGFFVAAILLANEFPDHMADKTAGKRTLVVKLGPDRARLLLPSLMFAALVVNAIAVLFDLLPLSSLILWLVAPLAVKASLRLHERFDQPAKLAPASQGVIATHAVGIILLSLGIALG